MKGDHVFVRRRLYEHHGIDLGDGRVIHFSGTPFRMKDATIVVSTMEEFLAGGVLVTRVYDNPAPADVVVARAMSRVGAGQYHLTWNNCEHFAVWAKTGKPKSGQVERAASLPRRFLQALDRAARRRFGGS